MKNQAMGFQSDLRTREASAAFAQDSQLEQEFFKSEFKERIKMLSPMMQGKTTCRGFRRVLATVMFWLFTLTTGAIAADGRGSTVVLAKLTPHQVLDGTAKRIGHYDPNQKLRLVFGIQPPNLEEEEQFLQDLQTKGSPLFHKYLTAEGWNARFAPSVDDEQSVVEWATRGGLRVTHRYPNRLLVDVEGPVSAIESAFNLKINAYQMGGKNYFSNDRDPEVPGALVGIIHSVGGLNNIQLLRPSNNNMQEPDFPVYSPGSAVAAGPSAGSESGEKQTKRGNPPITNGAYDPKDLWSSQAYDFQALYNQGHCCNPLGNSGGPPPAASIAIATAGAQNPNDFNGWAGHYGFWEHYFMYFIDGTPPACPPISNCDAEGTMDYEWSSAMANSSTFADTALVYLYDGANAQFSTFTDVYNAILNGGKARVFSTSWGCEEEYCTPVPVMQTDHNVFNQMLGQGWTLVAASGDRGATAGCGDADAVSYPASDPDVFAAGGTTLKLDANGNYVSEVAWSGGPDGCAANDGGSTGGFSAYFTAPSYQNGLGQTMRAVPDMALNADWYNTPQNFYFGGALQGNGGTSIVAPELAGFFAQENAYLLYIGSIANNTCRGQGSPCAPVGDPHSALYVEYFNHYAAHYPFYDITSGCNNNDITQEFNLPYFCAGSGYDEVTGLGSANMLQLAWVLNDWATGDNSAPILTFSGPAINRWYNTDQVVSWTVAEANGVAGFSQAWDSDPGDPYQSYTPGSGNSYYSGPQYPNLTGGCLDFTGAQCAGSVGQGCHTVNVRAWDNTGLGAGDKTYGPVCYDTIAPLTTAKLKGKLYRGVYSPPVTVTLNATDGGSGVASTWYKVDSGSFVRYGKPFAVSTRGVHVVTFYSVDNAGNVERNETVRFVIN